MDGLTNLQKPGAQRRAASRPLPLWCRASYCLPAAGGGLVFPSRVPQSHYTSVSSGVAKVKGDPETEVALCMSLFLEDK